MRISDWSSDVCSSDLRDGRARVARRRLLLDADRRRQPVDMLDVGLLHHLEELTRVSRQALDVAPLALDRKSVVQGKGVSVRVAFGGRRFLKKKTYSSSISNFNFR